VIVDQIASLTDQSAIDWHNRLVGEIDPAEVGIWTPRHARPGAREHTPRQAVVEGAG
jgi:dGTPase